MTQDKAHKIGLYDYNEKDFLGGGSFGKVYKGTNRENGKIVAMKTMDMAAFTDEFMIEALKTEIAVMKEFTSDHIVRLVDMFQNPKETILVIELCNGGDLLGFIEKHGGMLDEETAVDALQQAMTGFKEMVGRGYIHRDIKPENILIHEGVHKIADFGFACKADILGKKLITDCVGSPLYMAPQLLENHPYTSKSDIWSIAIVAFEMLYGRQPWPCRDINSYLQNIKNQPLKFPYEKQVSEEFKDFIKKCLVIDESKRMDWQTVFNHPVLMRKHQDKTFIQDKIDIKSQQILQEIQQIAQAKNLNIHQLFDSLDANHSGLLDVKEFYQFITSIDARVTQTESSKLFSVFDQNKDGQLSFDEFKRIFCEFDFADLHDRSGQIVVDLREIIKANKINLNDVFNEFDKYHNGQLDVAQFNKLIRIFAPAIKDAEIEKVFKRFDLDGNGTVSFDEFRKELQYALPNQDLKFDPLQERAQKILKELKRIVKDNKMDHHQIFNNFDVKGNGKLDQAEFNQLGLVIDATMTREESAAIFKIVDRENSGTISFEKFKKIFD